MNAFFKEHLQATTPGHSNLLHLITFDPPFSNINNFCYRNRTFKIFRVDITRGSPPEVILGQGVLRENIHAKD